MRSRFRVRRVVEVQPLDPLSTEEGAYCLLLDCGHSKATLSPLAVGDVAQCVPCGTDHHDAPRDAQPESIKALKGAP